MAKEPELAPPDTPGGWIGTDEAGKGNYFGPLVALQQLSQSVGVELAKGAGAPVLASGHRYVEKHGRDALGTVAKLHFKTTQQILAWQEN